MKTTKQSTGRIEPMVRISRFSIVWATFVILPQLIMAYIGREKPDHWIGLSINVISVLVWLFMPCHDKHFGQGRPLFWVRQTAFILGAVITFIVGF